MTPTIKTELMISGRAAEGGRRAGRRHPGDDADNHFNIAIIAFLRYKRTMMPTCVPPGGNANTERTALIGSTATGG